MSETKFFTSPVRDFNLLHINICGLATNFGNLLVFLQSLETEFDIIALSETHVFDNLDQFHINNYNVFSNESKVNRCDGTIIYAKNDLVTDAQIIAVNQSKFLKVTLLKNSMSIGVIAHYRLPSTSQDSYLLDLENLLQNNSEKCNVDIFVGDTNLNLLDSKSGNVNKYISILGSSGYKNLIDKHTRVAGETKSCIDHIAARTNGQNKLIQNLNTVILISSISDHYPVLLNLQLKPQEAKPSPNPQRIKFQKRINEQQLTLRLHNENWQDILQSRDPNCIAQKFVDRLQTHIKACTNTIKTLSKSKAIKPWITQGLVASIRNRDKLKKIASCNPHNPDLLNNYRNYRNLLTKLIKKAKTLYYQRSVAENMRNPGKLWQVIREVTNHNKCKNTVKAIKSDLGQVITDDKLMAENFNDFFSTVGEKLSEKIVIPNDILTDKKQTNSTIIFDPISDNDLIMEINSLKNGAAGGGDDVAVNMVKRNHRYLLTPLKHLVNGVFGCGVFPAVFKNSIVIPVYKSGSKTEINNYRPIALTSTISKIIEKCIKLRLCNFLETENLLSNAQFGFRRGRNTEDAIAEVTDFIVSGFNEGLKTLAVFLDLSKAFDTVKHHILLEKLKNYGIRGSAQNLFRTYLENRTQVVKIGNSASSARRVECGVPQGTVLGPILFLIYVNSLTSVDIVSKILCFADDTVLLIRDRTWQDAFDGCERTMSKIKQWLDSNLLTLNTEKTSFLAFSKTARGLPDRNSIKLHKFDCRFDDTCDCELEIMRKDNVKYLGVYFDQCMTWHNHVQYVNQKLRNLLFRFYELREVVAQKTLKVYYQALVESVINYGITAWGAACDSVLQPLIITQKYILKVMLFKGKRFSTELLFRESGLLNIRQLYIKNVIRFSSRNKKYNNIISHHTIGTRYNLNDNFTVPNTLFLATQRHISFTLPKILNVIPNNLKDCNYNRVKKRLDSYIIERYEQICNQIPWLRNP